jgi:tRNA uridine 5-carboxymethylaminomethyl modification enzyme
LRQNFPEEFGSISDDVLRTIDIEMLYAGQMHRQQRDIESFRRFFQMIYFIFVRFFLIFESPHRDEELSLPVDLDYTQLNCLSNEEKEKLMKYRPISIGAAGRIPGITPSSLILLLKYVRKNSANLNQQSEKDEQISG